MKLIYEAPLKEDIELSRSWEWIPEEFRKYNKRYFSKSPVTK